MDQQVRFPCAQHGRHRIGGYIHDPLRHPLRMGATAGARGTGQCPSRRLRQCQEALLYRRLAREVPEMLVAPVRSAEQIPMREHCPQVTGLQEYRIRQQAAAAALFEVRPQQEVAVAADDVAGNFAGRVFAQCLAHRVAHGLVVVIADPGLEQVAEYVQRIGLVRLATQKLQELRYRFRRTGIQMQIRDEQVAGWAHASNIVQACPKVLPAPPWPLPVSRNIRGCFASTIP